MRISSHHVNRSVQIRLFKGEPPWGEATAARIMTKIVLGERPDRPEATGALGLTTAVELSNGVLASKAGGPHNDLRGPCTLKLYVGASPRPSPDDRCAHSRTLEFGQRVSTVFASGSELPIGGATALTTVGTTRKFTEFANAQRDRPVYRLRFTIICPVSHHTQESAMKGRK